MDIRPFLSPCKRSSSPDNQQETSGSSPETDTKTSPENNMSDKQPGTSNQSQASEVKKEQDESRTFQYLFGSKMYSVTCYCRGTVLDALRTSDVFRNLMKNNLGKEVVIQREKHPRAAVCTDFPCHLIDVNEVVKVSFIKGLKEGSSSDVNGQNKQSNKRELQPGKLITFCIETEGGENMKTQVIKNQELRKKCTYVCVYAYKGENVKAALRRDGRFDTPIFKTKCVLLDPEGVGVVTEMSTLVDGLCGKTVQVKRVGRVAQPQPDSQEDCDNIQTEEPCEPFDIKPEAAPPTQNPTTPNTENIEEKGKEAEKDGIAVSMKQKRQEIPNTEEILEILRSQFADLVKLMTERGKPKKCSNVQRILREEFGKKTKGFQEVKTVESLIEQSASVCQVRIEGKPKGTGFLLFDKFILTNAHVIEPIYQAITNKLQQSVTVAFDFKDLKNLSENRHVELDVVVYDKKKDKSGCYWDFALLELSPGHDSNLPPGLLSNFSFPTTEGGICLIGHPEGGVKKMDLCFIVTYENRSQAIEKNLNENKEFWHVITERYFQENWDIDSYLLTDTGKITYDTCFFYGSSGSPVFNEHCQVVALHSGGYSYKDKKGKPQSVIEYAIPLSGILESIIIQAVIRKRVDILEGFLNQTRLNDKLCVVLNRVEEQSQNASLVSAFKENLPSNSNTAATGQEQQRTFYQFLFDNVTGEVPMDEDSSNS